VLSLYSARMVTVDSGKEFSGEAPDAFDDVDYISAVPDTVHTGLQLTVSPGAIYPRCSWRRFTGRRGEAITSVSD
jgi:hypothetical protein